MLFDRKYDVDAFKKQYEKANKNFNPEAMSGSDKEPNPRLFKTKMWYKMYSLAYKSYEKAKKANPTYYNQIESTGGDYSRRGQGVGEQVRAMYDFVKSEIAKSPDLKYSMMGVFIDVCDNLFDLKWRQAFKFAFDYANKDGKTKSLVVSFKLMYFCQAYAAEAMMLKFLDYEFRVDAGASPLEAIQAIQKENDVFMDKMVFPTINMNAMIKGTKDPYKMIKSYINGEKNSEKSSESLTPLTSEEGAFFTGLKKAGGNVLLMAVTGAGAVFAGLSLVSGVGTVGAVAGMIVTCIIFVWNTVALIRVMVYYCATSKIDMVKELELNKELLENNILTLKDKLKNMPNGKDKDKLQKVIDRQMKFKEDLDKKIAKNSDNDNAIEYSLDADESDADKESDSHAKDTDSDGDYTDNGDDFSIEI